MTTITRRITRAGASNPVIKAARARVAKLIKSHLGGRFEKQTPIPGLSVHGRTSPTAPASFLYEPSFAFVAQGSKRVVLGDDVYIYDESHFLLTAVGLPTIVQVLDASEAAPYYSMMMNIDLEMVRELISEIHLHQPKAKFAGTGMSIGPVTASLATSVMRLMEMLDSPEDIPILATPVQREILYRVLTSEIGECLQQAAQVGTQTNRVVTALRFIRKNFARPIHIGQLARIASLGESTLHRQFRALTAMSPLQYQKQLRLHAARHMMLNEQIDAASAAFRVGYESTTQFSREYRRIFGNPPKRDIVQMLSTDLD